MKKISRPALKKKPTYQTIKVMKANRAKHSKPELEVRKELWKEGIRGYRLHWKKAPGSPDIAFVNHKVAVIVNGCFWHGCQHCWTGFPKTNKDYWSWKIKGNRKRDERDIKNLKKEGWKVFVIWEHEIRNGKISFLVKKLKKSL